MTTSTSRRRTSAYAFTIAVADRSLSAAAHMLAADQLRDYLLVITGGPVIDSHHTVTAGHPAVSASVRLPNDDAARGIAALLDAHFDGNLIRVHTGYGIHRRVVCPTEA